MNAVWPLIEERASLSAIEAIEALHILCDNHGFSDPVSWLDYHKVRTFTRISARAIPQCPDCGEHNHHRIGQYVYYSTCLNLCECSRCRLVWSDAAIDAQVLSAHFETAYKDEQYFLSERAAVFAQVSAMLIERVPQGGKVLDVGGGMGHLLAIIRDARPDITCTVLDISRRSIEYAREHFDLHAICGTLQDIPEGEYYDAVVCIDVMYYEDDIRACWNALDRLSDTLIIRVPDKLRVIRWRQIFFKLTHSSRDITIQDTIPGFNPEHRYILGREYLTNRLRCMGYSARIEPAITRKKTGILGAVLNIFSVLARLCGISPAMIIIAERVRS